MFSVSVCLPVIGSVALYYSHVSVCVGSVTVRTHTSQRMVNRASRFQRSAGLDDLDSRPSGRDSPAPTSGSPGSSPGRYAMYHMQSLRHFAWNTIMVFFILFFSYCWADLFETWQEGSFLGPLDLLPWRVVGRSVCLSICLSVCLSL